MSQQEKIKVTVDCLGDICPLPLMKFKEMKKALEQGREIMLVTDHSCAAENVMDYCRSLHYIFSVEEPISGVWEITVHQTPDQSAGTNQEGEDPEEFDDEFEDRPSTGAKRSIWHW